MYQGTMDNLFFTMLSCSRIAAFVKMCTVVQENRLKR